MTNRAVLTGDIVNSTKLGEVRENKLMERIRLVLTTYQFEFYRGDSFQVLIKDPGEALRASLLCRTAAISLPAEKENESFDIRISIGVGGVDDPFKTLGAAKGTAFVLSGRAFDEMAKTETRLAITTSLPIANEGMQVIADYINAIFKDMTEKQAAVIYELLSGKTQLEVAKNIGRTKSTINQHVSAGRWPEIERLLKQYENIINQLI